MKIIITEQQKNNIQQYIVSEQKIYNIISVIYDNITEQIGPESPIETAERYNKRFSDKYPNGIFNRVFNFGVFGNDDIALAETKNGCFIFINKNGKPIFSFKMNLDKIFKRSELVAAMLNSMLGKPRYKYVVNVYDDCKMKVITSNDDILIINSTSGLPSNGENVKHCVSYPKFTPDVSIIKKSHEIENRQLSFKKQEKNDFQNKQFNFNIK